MQKFTYVSCLSCGRTILGVEKHEEEFAETLYCIKCRAFDGKVKPFVAILEIVTCDIQKDCDCTYNESQQRAEERLKKMPYWKEVEKAKIIK